MTRINTNVGSLMAQNSLARSNQQLQQALTRLSTGLRINTGKDDPAGLIASEVLRSDMLNIERAISNTERANQVIATADSALGQVSSLLNDIRSLVTEAANTGALSDEQIAANQLQVDSSLEAINRIAQVTNFQGRKLLDGTLDFVTTAGSIATIEDIQIDQAAIGSTGQVAVDVDITTAAAKAAITNDGFTDAAAASATLDFAMSVEHSITGASFVVTSKSLTDATLYEVNIVEDADHGVGAPGVAFDGAAVTVTLDDSETVTTLEIVQAINACVESDCNTLMNAAVKTGSAITWDGGDAADKTMSASSIDFTAVTQGAVYNNVAISIATSADVVVDAPTAEYDSTLNTITITVNDAAQTDLDDITALFGAGVDATVAEFTAAKAGAGGSDCINGAEVDVDATGNTGITGGSLLNDDIVLQVGGKDGMEVFSFQAGAGANQMVAAINLVTDATGVQASVSGNTLTLNSNDYGTKAYVEVEVISEGSSGTFKDSLSAVRDEGEDIVATVNGIGALGDGNELSINTSTLALSILVTAGSDTDFDFNITGGGALFQLGPEVVSNQQARLGIQSVNTARMRGASGRLYEIGTGEAAALADDPTTAASIVDEVITKVTSLRGRLGAFQRTTLDTNVATLTDTLENLTDAESMIRDADFAAESAALTRAQILVQSGVSVLSIANTNPQNVLALLR